MGLRVKMNLCSNQTITCLCQTDLYSPTLRINPCQIISNLTAIWTRSSREKRSLWQRWRRRSTCGSNWLQKVGSMTSDWQTCPCLNGCSNRKCPYRRRVESVLLWQRLEDRVMEVQRMWPTWWCISTKMATQAQWAPIQTIKTTLTPTKSSISSSTKTLWCNTNISRLIPKRVASIRILIQIRIRWIWIWISKIKWCTCKTIRLLVPSNRCPSSTKATSQIQAVTASTRATQAWGFLMKKEHWLRECCRIAVKVGINIKIVTSRRTKRRYMRKEMRKKTCLTILRQYTLVVNKSRAMEIHTVVHLFLNNSHKTSVLRLGTKTLSSLWSSESVTSSTIPTFTPVQTQLLTKTCSSISSRTTSRYYRWDSRMLTQKPMIQTATISTNCSHSRKNRIKQTMKSSWWEGLQIHQCFIMRMIRLLTRTQRMEATMRTIEVKMSRSPRFIQGNSHQSHADLLRQWVIMPNSSSQQLPARFVKCKAVSLQERSQSNSSDRPMRNSLQSTHSNQRLILASKAR